MAGHISDPPVGHVRELAVALRQNRYPGRGLIIGRTPSGRELVHLYWMTGRSVSSRNRRIVKDPDASLRTQLIDPGSVADPSLLVYRAMACRHQLHVTSNGVHTETVLDALAAGDGMQSALQQLTFEPDPPLFTPRIMGATDPAGDSHAVLAIVRTLNGDPEVALRSVFCYSSLPPGVGACLTTYADDGDPPPTSSGEPALVTVAETAAENLSRCWQMLPQDKLVAVAVKHIDQATGGFSVTARNRADHP